MLGQFIKRLVREMFNIDELDRRFGQGSVPAGTAEALTAANDRIEWLVAELDRLGLPSWEQYREAMENDLPLPPGPPRPLLSTGATPTAEDCMRTMLSGMTQIRDACRELDPAPDSPFAHLRANVEAALTDYANAVRRYHATGPVRLPPAD